MEMVYFNILFDVCPDDVDIICVPCTIAENINSIVQMFFDWLPNAADEAYWTMINGRKVSVCETDGFVKWLNENHCKNVPKAYIVAQHTQICKAYAVIEF